MDPATVLLHKMDVVAVQLTEIVATTPKLTQQRDPIALQ
jgi:hypothetical protein